MIEKRLSELVPQTGETIFEAARYSLLSPGKRLRPLLTLAAAEDFGGDRFIALDPACALEMVHAYSLIHDDLPCMDDDDLRRGKPTLHKVYGEGMALLAGDYLLTRSFEVIADAEGLRSDQKIEMIKVLSQRAGAPGMIGGQAIDIASEGKEIDEGTLLAMHYGKTAALLTACLEVGCLAAGGERSGQLQSIGLELGLAYQFQDDLLNAMSTTAVLGKKVGTDAAKGKPTAVALFGIEATQRKLKDLEQSLFQKIEQLPGKGIHLAPLIQKILQRKW